MLQNPPPTPIRNTVVMDVVTAGSTKKESDNSKYCVFVILITQIPTACIFGLNLGVLNTASPVIEIFINETYTVGALKCQIQCYAYA